MADIIKSTGKTPNELKQDVHRYYNEQSTNGMTAKARDKFNGYDNTTESVKESKKEDKNKTIKKIDNKEDIKTYTVKNREAENNKMSLTYKIKAKNLMEKSGLISKELADKAQKEADIDGIIRNIIGTKVKQVDRSIIATVKNGRYRVTDKNVNGESEIAKTVASLVYFVYIDKQIPEEVFDDTSIGISNGNKILTINISDVIKHDFQDGTLYMYFVI